MGRPPSPRPEAQARAGTWHIDFCFRFVRDLRVRWRLDEVFPSLGGDASHRLETMRRDVPIVATDSDGLSTVVDGQTA